MDSRGRGAGAGRGAGRGRDPRTKRSADSSWIPSTKLGRLVQDGKINKIEEVFMYSLPIKEPKIIDKFFPDLKDDLITMFPVQKATSAGQRNRFKAYVVVGDSNGHVGLGSKCSKETAIAISGATNSAKLSIVPVRRGYWGAKLGAPHTVSQKATGKCGSVRVRLIPAPRGTGVVAAPVSKKILTMAGIHDVYTSTEGKTKTRGNFATATYKALSKTYGFLTPDLWTKTVVQPDPYQEHTDHLMNC
ncbi:40S ribosomal protein s2 [Perkinsela sp. CCAP 1560/4]|nr:40S ribosomal protein s2 [Perkinsela sp. CCAP 1560/4]|eukprot:KNH07478.1 40S ribosomal protein s2 [Perkinsela sp. CCAP 1560/4]